MALLTPVVADPTEKHHRGDLLAATDLGESAVGDRVEGEGLLLGRRYRNGWLLLQMPGRRA